MKLTPEAQSTFDTQRYDGREEIDGVQIVPLRRFADDGGSMTELLRLDDGRAQGLEGFTAKQINYSTVEPGAIKAFHLHHRQTDVWYVPPEDRILLVLVDVRSGSATGGTRIRHLMGDSRPALVRIPPGVAHGCRNLGSRPARIVYFTDLHFSPEPGDCDEGRLPWDFVGPEIWEVVRG